MQTNKYLHWQEDGYWLGYLEEFPGYWTQGDNLADLVEGTSKNPNPHCTCQNID
jgi:predicted RNase H-like HicB family nuclease